MESRKATAICSNREDSDREGNLAFVQVPAIVEGNVKSEADQLVTVDVDLLESCDL